MKTNNVFGLIGHHDLVLFAGDSLDVTFPSGRTINLEATQDIADVTLGERILFSEESERGSELGKLEWVQRQPVAEERRRWVVRIVIEKTPTNMPFPTLMGTTLDESFLAMLKAAGVVHLHRNDDSGVCFDLLPPDTVTDSSVWATRIASLMEARHYNAVKAPRDTTIGTEHAVEEVVAAKQVVVLDRGGIEIVVGDPVSCQGADGRVAEGNVKAILATGVVFIVNHESKSIESWAPTHIDVISTDERHNHRRGI